MWSQTSTALIYYISDYTNTYKLDYTTFGLFFEYFSCSMIIGLDRNRKRLQRFSLLQPKPEHVDPNIFLAQFPTNHDIGFYFLLRIKIMLPSLDALVSLLLSVFLSVVSLLFRAVTSVFLQQLQPYNCNPYHLPALSAAHQTHLISTYLLL